MRPTPSITSCAALTFALSLGQQDVAQAQQPSPAAVDAIFAEYDRAASPGCALAVVQDGAITYQRGYGSANLDYSIPNGPDMVYYVGSVSKQFTAAAVALLAEEGRVSLDDDVRRYIPELPDYGRTMTIRHLVHHTSGLRDIYALMSLAGIRMEDVLTDEDALALIARQRELNFLPGDDYLYSNSGYWLLGQIIERVTGESLREYADRRIFQPLAMTSTHFHDEPGHVMPNRAMSYSGPDDGYRIAYLQNFDKVGAGGLYSTLADLARWDASFYGSGVGGPQLLETLHTRGVLSSGDTLAYAFGNNVQQRRGLPVVRHSGSLMGFRADIVRYPAQRFSVITLCNHGSIDAGGLADGVTELYLGAQLAPAPAPRAAAPPTPAVAPAAGARAVTAAALTPADFTGSYYSVELDATWIIRASGDTLHVERTLDSRPLRPAGPDRFSAGSQQLEFSRDDRGGVTGFTVQAGRVRNLRFERVETWDAPRAPALPTSPRTAYIQSVRR